MHLSRVVGTEKKAYVTKFPSRFPMNRVVLLLLEVSVDTFLTIMPSLVGILDAHNRFLYSVPP